MKKEFALFAIFLFFSFCCRAESSFKWDGKGHHKVEGSEIILHTQVPPARLCNVPVKAGKRYRLHYSACGIGESGSNAMFHNLQITTEPRAEGSFFIQDVRNVKTPAFQNFSIPAKARYRTIDILFELKTSKGKVRISDLRLEEINPDPTESWNAEITYPFYRKTLFATDKERCVRGRINVPKEVKTFTVQLLDSSEKTVKEVSSANLKCNADYFISLEGLPAGNYFLKTTLSDGRQTKNITEELIIAPELVNEYKIGRNNIVTFNGKPFFPIFYFFEMVEEDFLYTSQRNGVNISIMGFNGESYMLRELDGFHKYGFKGIILIDQRGHISSPEKFAGFEKAVRERVTQKIKDHPAFMGYIIDEPMWQGIPLKTISSAYNFLKKYDPGHPVWINSAPRNEVADLKLYAEYADIYGADIYPVPYPSGHSHLADRTPSCVGEYTQRSRQAVENKKPIWMVLQGNSWSDYSDRPSVLYPYPTADEQRFMAFDVILAGASGLAFYSPEKGRSWDYQLLLLEVSREIQLLSGLFYYGNRIADAKVSDPAVRCGLWEYNGKIFGIAVNRTSKKQNASLTLPPGVIMKSISGRETGKVYDPAKLALRPYETIVFGDINALPPALWQPCEVNETIEKRGRFKEYITGRGERREKYWKESGKYPPMQKNQN